MKNLVILALALFAGEATIGQRLASGDYGFGLQIAVDSTTNKITGYYEMESGWDDNTKAPRFSCAFYVEGTVSGTKVKIGTYDPGYKKDDLISGTLEIIGNKQVKIKLDSDHGGCGMVHSFAGDPTDFSLEKPRAWIQVRYVTSVKTNFYSDKTEQSKLRSYLVQNNVVFVSRIEGEWGYCTYFGKKTGSGWIKLTDLNKL